MIDQESAEFETFPATVRRKLWRLENFDQGHFPDDFEEDALDCLGPDYEEYLDIMDDEDEIVDEEGNRWD